MFFSEVVYLIGGVFVEEGIGVAYVFALAQQGQILLGGTSAHHLHMFSSAWYQPHIQFLVERLGHHIDLIFPQLFLENVKISSVEYYYCIFLCDEKDLTFLHLLAEGHSFGQFKGIALDPLASGLEATVNLVLYLSQGNEIEFVVEGKVEDQFLSFNVSGWGVDVGLSPWNRTAGGFLLFPCVSSLPKHLGVQFRKIDRNDVDWVDGGNGQQAAVSILSISLKIESEHGGDLCDCGDGEVKIWDNVMGHFYCQGWEETFLDAAYYQLMPYVGENNQRFVAFGSGE